MTANQAIVDLEGITNTCFVIMPFHSLFQTEYEKVIKRAAASVGLRCDRGDEIYAHQSIVQDVWKSIRQARVIVAELSGLNPNVMYEVGLAHAVGKPIVLLTREQDGVPFNLRELRFIYYDPNNPFWGQDLETELTKILRKVLDTPTLADHLAGITLNVNWPQTPDKLLPSPPVTAEYDFSGSWFTTWLSIRKGREHRAVLVIPPQTGRDLTATVTVQFERENQRTIIEETMTGRATGRQLNLTAVTYTYVERGSSISYSLDNFDLEISEDKERMAGEAKLRHGTRPVVFKRVTDGQVANLLNQDPALK